MMDASTFASPRTAHHRPTTPPLVIALLALNAAVFLVWQLARFLSSPDLVHIMARNFTVSAAHLEQGMVWTLLTAAFSHFHLWHFVFNMVVLWSFGGPLAKLLGWRQFLVFYLATAVFSSAAHCAVSAVLLGQPGAGALGASGALSGLLLVYALLFPKHRILIMGIVPVPALVGVLAFVAFDVWGLFAQSSGGGLPIGHGAHLGGTLCGAVMFYGVLRDRVEKLRAKVGGAPPVLSAHEMEEFQRLRRKLDEEGPMALTPKEKDFLMQIRERAMGRD